MLGGCASTQKLSEPVPVQAPRTIAEATDWRVTASIETVIVSGGPAAWAKNAFWDEYRIRVAVAAGWPVEVTRIVVVDSLGERHRPRNILAELKKDSNETVERYEDSHIRVTAGLGAGEALLTGYAIGSASAAVGLATLGTTGVGAGAAMAGALVVAPALMVASIVGAVEEQAVQTEIDRRSSVFPVAIEGAQEQTLDVFFTLAPSPERVEVKYRDAAGVHVLVIDTKTALAGLHLLPVAESNPSQTHPSP
ncbi:MAG: hypothetical protein MUO39_04135 [Steroidobacteraceae bacterium]|nr:hypothetical protein [Steroidobacteraceae bacterium]